MKKTKIVLAVLAVVAALVWLNNTSLFGPSTPGTTLLLAHRGMAQTYSREDLANDTCTATRVAPPEHSYLENTLASMKAAFDAGADIVEFDVHPTTDGQFAVFHDWTLDCRTDGSGVTREQSLTSLKQRDIGYGYTADGGKTFPFRGKGVGLMPSLDEVLAAFPDRRFLINVKSNDPAEGEKLAERLAKLPPEHLSRLMAYGGDRPMAALRARLPSVAVMSRQTLMRCGLKYIALGWSGVVPGDCANTLMLVPSNYTWLMWGWPQRFTAWMRAAGTLVAVIGPYQGGDPGSTGVDDAAALATLPSGYDGAIWTNRVERIAPMVRQRRP